MFFMFKILLVLSSLFVLVDSALKDWSKEIVRDWIAGITNPETANKFFESEADGTFFQLLLDEAEMSGSFVAQTLSDLGVTSPVARIKVFAKLREAQSTQPAKQTWRCRIGKKRRRKKDSVSPWHCPGLSCQKGYKSRRSLAVHIKLKHAENENALIAVIAKKPTKLPVIEDNPQELKEAGRVDLDEEMAEVSQDEVCQGNGQMEMD